MPQVEQPAPEVGLIGRCHRIHPAGVRHLIAGMTPCGGGRDTGVLSMGGWVGWADTGTVSMGGGGA